MESKIKIHFNEYAIKKYGCSELDLKIFHEDYKDAIIYYQKLNNRKIISGTLLTLDGVLRNDVEYDLKRENSYILKEIIFQDVAEDYNKLRTLINKKS